MSVTKYNPPTQSADSFPTYKDNIDASIRVLGQVAAAFAPRESDVPAMTVTIDGGKIHNGIALLIVAPQVTTTFTAPTTNPRIDRVVINSSTGVYSIVTGAEAASPVAPDIPVDTVPVCQISMYVGQTEILNADITDERVSFGGGSKLFNKLDATVAPTVNNDGTEGYSEGSFWIDVTNDEAYRCVDNTTGAAVWINTTIDLVEIQALIDAGVATAQHYQPTQSATPNMTITVSPGTAFDGTFFTDNPEQVSEVIVAPTVNPRIDRAVLDTTSGEVLIVTGTEAASPVAPAIPPWYLPCCQISLSVGQTQIFNANITDERLDGTIAHLIKNNYWGSAAPTVNDDESQGYQIGSFWIDGTNDKVYQCISPIPLGSAVWVELTGGGVGNPLQVGVEDTTAGVIDVFGNGTGSTQGGKINLHFAADHDAVYNGWLMQARSTDFAMEAIGAGFDYLSLDWGGSHFKIGSLQKTSVGYSFGGSANQLVNVTGQKFTFGGSTTFPDFFFNFPSVSGSNQDLGRIGSSHDSSSEMTSAIRFMGGTDTTNQSDGHIAFDTSPSGTFPAPVERARIHNDGGMTLGSPTGGSQGAGTINATGLYVNGVAAGGGGGGGYTLIAHSDGATGETCSFGTAQITLASLAIPADTLAVGDSLIFEGNWRMKTADGAATVMGVSVTMPGQTFNNFNITIPSGTNNCIASFKFFETIQQNTNVCTIHGSVTLFEDDNANGSTTAVQTVHFGKTTVILTSNAYTASIKLTMGTTSANICHQAGSMDVFYMRD